MLCGTLNISLVDTLHVFSNILNSSDVPQLRAIEAGVEDRDDIDAIALQF